MTQNKKLMIILYSLTIVGFFAALVHSLTEILLMGKNIDGIATNFFLNFIFVLIALGLMNLDIFLDNSRALSIKSCLFRGLVAALLVILFYLTRYTAPLSVLSSLINIVLIFYCIIFFILIEFCFFRIMEKFLKNNKAIF